MSRNARNVRLSSNWRISNVRRSLRQKNKSELVSFLRERQNERFFGPIQTLKLAAGNQQGYGFATMALCSLLVETIQSFRDGLPTTFGPELQRLKASKRVPPAFQIPIGLQVNGKKAFQKFFRTHRRHFPRIHGDLFYKNIRNGLLHQAQTKGGWTIMKSGPVVFDTAKRTLYRDNFAEALNACFEDYLGTVRK